jgi:peptidoglycan/xylan/chitin deacetylase (PgdA/CDA1 family)
MLKDLIFRGATVAGLDRALRRVHRGQLKVLLYHNIERNPGLFGDSVPADEFARHLKLLKDSYNLVRLSQTGEIEGMVPDRVNVLLTFDDGFINNLDVAVPILVDHGVSAAFFVIVDCLESGSPPDFQLARLEVGADLRPWRTVTGADVRAMREAGMTIGSHGLSHIDHRLLTPSDLLEQTRQSRSQLEDVLGEPAACFAFPWGFHNPGQDEALLEVFARVFLTRHGFTTPTARIMPRNEVASLAHLPHAVSGLVDIGMRA